MMIFRSKQVHALASLFTSLLILIACSTANSQTLQGSPLTSPDFDENFLKLSTGEDLSKMRVKSRKLTLTRGEGHAFDKTHQQNFDQLFEDGSNNADSPFQWALMNLDSGEVINESLNSGIKIFGASVSKIFVGATYLHRHSEQGKIPQRQLQKLANMLVVSSNSAWLQLQKDIGHGNANKGRRLNLEFTQALGYERTRGFQGYLETNSGERLHGNELTAIELVEFLRDTYWQQYQGAEVIWKLMHTVRTAARKVNKYLPSGLYLGGKTGTYSGETVDPETGKDTFPDGSPYRVSVRNQVAVLYYKGTQYGLAILTNAGQNEHVSLLAAGLFQQFIKSRGEALLQE